MLYLKKSLGLARVTFEAEAIVSKQGKKGKPHCKRAGLPLSLSIRTSNGLQGKDLNAELEVNELNAELEVNECEQYHHARSSPYPFLNYNTTRIPSSTISVSLLL